jgi:hypothetical protein
MVTVTSYLPVTGTINFMVQVTVMVPVMVVE